MLSFYNLFFLAFNQKADVDKQLASVRTFELEELNEKSRLEEVLEQLANLQASANAATEQNQVNFLLFVY